MANDALYWIWLSQRCGVASRDVAYLVAKYDDPFELYRMDDSEIAYIAGISNTLRNKLCNKNLEESISVMRRCEELGVDIITYVDKRYPVRLRGIEDAPALLYCMGELPDLNSELCIAMVGTRRMSAYGMENAYKISYELASAGAVIVSGMAMGIDGVSACGTLEAKGKTVAVLGCGVNVAYPSMHKSLMKEIVKGGAVISEYPPDDRPRKYNFPKRNRIISGMSHGTIIIEGNIGSGSLITASKAIEQGRDIFALPGNINQSNSEGPNKLIKDGANVMLSSSDVIDFYSSLYSDVIDKNAYKASRNNSCVSERILSKYGVTWVGYTERYVPVNKVEAKENNKDTSYKAKNNNKFSSDKNSTDIVKDHIASAPERSAIQSEKNEERVTVAPTAQRDTDRVLAAVDSVTRNVYESIPTFVDTFTPDAITAKGFTAAEAITALTMLEVVGLVTSLPGGKYKRNPT